jgi:hypothetical protein
MGRRLGEYWSMNSLRRGEIKVQRAWWGALRQCALGRELTSHN